MGLRRSRSGRVLIAIRENEDAARAYGVGVTQAKLAAFALSGAIAGAPGAVYTLHQGAFKQALFLPEESVATFIGGFAKTAQQATTMTAVATFGLSLLGGNFTGPADAPAALRALRRITPNGRALTAFTEVSTDAASIASIGWTLITLLLFGFVFGAIGLLLIRRTVAS